MKLNAMTIAAILFMVLMLGSTIAYSFIQAINYGLGGGSSKTQLPSTNIIDYQLSIDQEQLLLTQGKTVMKYSYSSTCVECLTFANQLEGLANSMSGQVFVEKLLQTSANQTAALTLTSSQNSKIYSNPTTNDLIDGLCDVLISPPVDCAVRKLNTT